MNIGIIVQCRMSSTRLPGKVLHAVQRKPMLQYTLERLGQCRRGQVVVATSDEKTDESIVRFCHSFGVPCRVGPLQNVALRFADVVKHYGFDCFVRVCGDSPLIDYRLVDHALDLFVNNPHAMVTNIRRRTFPKGQSVEVIDGNRFLSMVSAMSAPEDQEHVTPYCYKHLSDNEVLNFESSGDYGEIQHSIDTREDMAWFENVISAMTRPHWEYSYTDILAMGGVEK